MRATVSPLTDKPWYGVGVGLSDPAVDTGRHTMTAMTYEDRCKWAATNQGLDPIVERLTAEGIDHEVEQTGGFTMVVTVAVPSGTVAVTADTEGYAMGFYPGRTWHDGPTEDSDDPTDAFDQTLDQVVAAVRSHQRP
jgi:hypothetical protein